jgi:hypothetical protein
MARSRRPATPEGKAKYQRRKARGLARGLSLSQARGHAGGVKKPAAQAAQIIPTNIRRAQREMRYGKSLSAAAKSVGVAPERLRHALKSEGLAEKRGRRWLVTSNRDLIIRLPVYTVRDGAISVEVDEPTASMIGAYMNQLQSFLKTRDLRELTLFEEVTFRDITGKEHMFETDPATLVRLAAQTPKNHFEKVYRVLRKAA